jgi:hypothetical protein
MNQPANHRFCFFSPAGVVLSPRLSKIKSQKAARQMNVHTIVLRGFDEPTKKNYLAEGVQESTRFSI